ncbi:MAG TPA: hypothetical protein VIV07_01305 [Sphingomicrobium sp.]
MSSPVQLSLKELASAEALDHARQDIQDKLAEDGSRLASLNWDIMRNATRSALADALSKLDVLEYVASAWCTATELQEKARQTLKAPGSEEKLALAEHDPSALLHPVVKIKCGPVELPALTFDLEVGAAVECAVLIVTEGKLAAIEAGSFKPFAKLSYNGNQLNKLDADEVPITRCYHFPNGGIPIPCSPEPAVETNAG